MYEREIERGALTNTSHPSPPVPLPLGGGLLRLLGCPGSDHVVGVALAGGTVPVFVGERAQRRSQTGHMVAHVAFVT